MTVYFLSALSPNHELIPVVITMAICSIKADVNCKDNDTLRCSDQTKLENYVLISGISKIHFSQMIGKPYLISFYFSFVLSLFTNLPPVVGTLPNYPNPNPSVTLYIRRK